MFVLKHFYGVYMAMQSNCLLDSTFRYYLNNEYTDYDYDFEKDILPHINNMFPDLSPMKIWRPLENIHIFLKNNSLCFAFYNFNFHTLQQCSSLSLVFNLDYTSEIYFINCRFGVGTGIDLPPYGAHYYNCVFDDSYVVQLRQDADLTSPFGLELKDCTVNSIFMMSFEDVAIDISIDKCIFNEKSSFILTDYNKNEKFSLFDTKITNSIFKGVVKFDNSCFNSQSLFEYLTFYDEVSFRDVKLTEDVKLNHLVFAPLATPNQKDGFNTFIQALKNNKRSSEAAFYANNAEGINLHEKHSSKEDIDIAIKSDWLTIRQAATVLGIAYPTLLAMRKEDNATGIVRIPYVGTGKSTRYYYPLLIAYKSHDMKRVNELAKEMEKRKDIEE